MHTRRQRRGSTAIEYALIGSLIGLAIVVALSQLGNVVEVFYSATAALVTASV